MPYILKNNNLEVYIDDPSENYQSSRFDWTGKVTHVKYNGIPFTTSEKINEVQNEQLGKGFYNEFGIKTALGFKETKIGNWFHKIGIGLLKKESKKYKFSKHFEIQPAKFRTIKEGSKVVIICTSETVNGYSYILQKEFTLKEDSLEISYRLENTGSKIIETDEYVHNFISINHTPIQSDYCLNFPFTLHPEVFGKIVNKEAKVDIKKNQICFINNPKEQFFFSRLAGKKCLSATWEIIDQAQKIGVREVVSFDAYKINVWGWSHVVSPELYHQIILHPSEKTHWTRSYQFFQNS